MKNSEFLTDEQVEEEIARLTVSKPVKLARKTRANLNSAIAAVLISIPIIIAKVKSAETSEIGRRPSEHEIDIQIAENTATLAAIEVTEQLVTDSDKPVTNTFAGYYSFVPLEIDFQAELYRFCIEHELAYDLVLSVMKAESDFLPDVVGDEGQAIGLMQIQPKWWDGFASAAGLSIYEPVDNAKLGVLILEYLMELNKGDLFKSLRQYSNGNPEYEGTEYLDMVFANYQWILEQKGAE